MLSNYRSYEFERELFGLLHKYEDAECVNDLDGVSFEVETKIGVGNTSKCVTIDFSYESNEYRAFKTIEEVEAVFGKIAKDNTRISFVISEAYLCDGVVFVNGLRATTFLEDYTIDGKPAGVLL